MPGAQGAAMGRRGRSWSSSYRTIGMYLSVSRARLGWPSTSAASAGWASRVGERDRLRSCHRKILPFGEVQGVSCGAGREG